MHIKNRQDLSERERERKVELEREREGESEREKRIEKLMRNLCICCISKNRRIKRDTLHASTPMGRNGVFYSIQRERERKKKADSERER